MIAIIDYGAGNVASVANALISLNEEFIISNSENEIRKADKIIFPGVGQASFAMKKLSGLNLITVLNNYEKPILGICLGMQLMAKDSEEGNVKCLGVFNSTVQKFDPLKMKVPHMGWNSINIIKQTKLFNSIKNGEYFYFANSYFLPVINSTTSTCDNKIIFSASIEYNNFYAVQFHPEKSGKSGLKIIENFIKLC